jgi:hypothetical protein
MNGAQNAVLRSALTRDPDRCSRRRTAPTLPVANATPRCPGSYPTTGAESPVINNPFRGDVSQLGCSRDSGRTEAGADPAQLSCRVEYLAARKLQPAVAPVSFCASVWYQFALRTPRRALGLASESDILRSLQIFSVELHARKASKRPSGDGTPRFQSFLASCRNNCICRTRHRCCDRSMLR